MEKISFTGAKLLSLSYQTDQEINEDNLAINFESSYADDDDRKFIVRFYVDIASKNGTSISLEYGGLFETNASITEEFQNGSFPTVNAPAIVFPYLRSFLNTFTLNAGDTPITLPTVNFQALANVESNKTE